MTEPHVGPGGRTFIGTVVFVDIVEYSRTTVAQQVELKSAFNTVLADSLHHVAAADRIVLDTGDGAAVCFLGDPEDALFAANSLAEAASRLPGPPLLRLRIGVNLGPVKVVKDINGNPNILGDGINDAQRVMSFAEPQQILVSRSFFEVVSRLSQEYAQLFQFAGVRRDKHIREHEVYRVAVGAGRGATPPEGGASEDPYVMPGPSPPSVRAGGGEGPGECRLAPETLRTLAEVLAPEVGPVAKLLVQRATGEAPDADALLAALTDSLPPARRGEVGGRLAALIGVRQSGSDEPAPARVPAERGAGAVPLSRELLARAEERLARHIGPLAKVLVRNAARRAASPRDLYRALAVHIDDAAARTAFVAAADD